MLYQMHCFSQQANNDYLNRNELAGLSFCYTTLMLQHAALKRTRSELEKQQVTVGEVHWGGSAAVAAFLHLRVFHFQCSLRVICHSYTPFSTANKTPCFRQYSGYGMRLGDTLHLAYQYLATQFGVHESKEVCLFAQAWLWLHKI